MSLDNEQSKVIQGRFILTRKLGAGSFGEIFEAKDLKTGKLYACKAESLRTKHPQLRLEYQIYRALQNSSSFVRVWGFVTHYNHQIMIMDKLGDSLEQLFTLCGRKFSIRCVCQIAIQILHRIEELHKHNYLHRDIKPDNFLIGHTPGGKMTHEEAGKIYMIDLGLGKVWKEGGRHIPEKTGKRLIGTPRYASINTHFGHEQSRRDDLESLGYMLMYFAHGQLPWQGLRGQTKEEKYQKIGHKKKETRLHELCNGYPREFQEYLNHTQKLGFQEDPPYEQYRSWFRSVLRKHQSASGYDFDWQNKGNPSRSKKVTSSNNMVTQRTTRRQHHPPQAAPNNTTNHQSRTTRRRTQIPNAVSNVNGIKLNPHTGNTVTNVYNINNHQTTNRQQTSTPNASATNNGRQYVSNRVTATHHHNQQHHPSPRTNPHHQQALQSPHHSSPNRQHRNQNTLNHQAAAVPQQQSLSPQKMHSIPVMYASNPNQGVTGYLTTTTTTPPNHNRNGNNGIQQQTLHAQLPQLQQSNNNLVPLSSLGVTQNHIERYQRCRNVMQQQQQTNTLQQTRTNSPQSNTPILQINGNAQSNAVAVNALLQQQVNGGNLFISNAATNPNAHRGYSSATAYDLTGSNGNNGFVVQQQQQQPQHNSTSIQTASQMVSAYRKLEQENEEMKRRLRQSQGDVKTLKQKNNESVLKVQTLYAQIQQLTRERDHWRNMSQNTNAPPVKRRKLNSMQRSRMNHTAQRI